MTSLDRINIVWKALDASPLKTAITGMICKQSRPINSKNEDVVINSLPVLHGQLQSGIVNVNIHVPNLVINIGGVQDDTQPDIARLGVLGNMAIGILEEVWNPIEEYNFSVQQDVMFPDPEAGDHYLNIRLEFFNTNISN